MEGGVSMNQKQKQIYEILLMPIVCTKHSGFEDKKIEVKKRDNLISATQSYWTEYIDKTTGKPFRYDFSADCDMSDFAVGFYKILYKLSIVDNNGNLVDKEFAGDTMTSVSKLPELKEKYHCLANFWFIPMELGRKSNSPLSKTSNTYQIQDFMDRFLLLVKFKFGDYHKNFGRYFKANSFKEFVDKNFLVGSYVDENYDVIEYSHSIDESTVEHLIDCMKKRAEAIATSRCCDDLWDYFVSLGLIERL